MSALDAAIATIIASLKSGGTVWTCGNGGSDAHAGHLAAELIGRFAYDRPPLRAVHLPSGGPVGSCIANDYGFEEVFARQVRALVNGDDVVIGFTTSGKSPNVLLALRIAPCPVIVLTGPSGIQGSGWERSPSATVVRSTATTTAEIQEEHQRWVHEVARRVEEALCQRT